jgi:hypothetical protein
LPRMVAWPWPGTTESFNVYHVFGFGWNGVSVNVR